MIAFTVHEPPEPPADRLDRGAVLEFIREGFSWGAAILGPVWLIAQRAWLALLVYIAVLVAGFTVLELARIGSGAELAFLAGVHFLLGAEAASLKRWQLQRRGWLMLGTVSGRSEEECEQRFLDSWLAPKSPAGQTAIGSAGAAGADDGSGKRSWWRPWRRRQA